MARHRGTYKPEHESPYELSRSKVESFIKCPACFWLDRAKGVKFPSIPGFLLNSNTDKLLKKDFDQYRGKAPHPIMIDNGLEHLIPFDHSDMPNWENSLSFGKDDHHFNTFHEETNFIFGGGLDDVWQNTKTGELHIVDYKSTSNQRKEPEPVNLDGKWKKGYKRQMDMYQWVMRRKGFEVSNIGYFLYVDGLHLGYDGMLNIENTTKAVMHFDTSILEYEGSDQWVEQALFNIKELLQSDKQPEHSEECEHGIFLEQVAALKGT
jgi:hypothetical protein